MSTTSFCNSNHILVGLGGTGGKILRAFKMRMFEEYPEYGTYTYKDGWYSEMGREKRKDAIVWVDKTTTKGTWKTRHDIWKKQTAMPEKLRRYIVDCCKKKEMPADMQQLMKENVFK